jgi:hypothetical protein
MSYKAIAADLRKRLDRGLYLPGEIDDAAQIIERAGYTAPGQSAKPAAPARPEAKKTIKHKIEKKHHVETTEIVDDDDEPECDCEPGDPDCDCHDEESEDERGARLSLTGRVHAVLGEAAAKRVSRLHRKVASEKLEKTALHAVRTLAAMRGESAPPRIMSMEQVARQRDSAQPRVVVGKFGKFVLGG